MTRARGFTLLEVMLAVFLVALALLPLQAVVSGGLLSAGNSVNQRAARELCRERLELYVAGESADEAGEDRDRGFRWRIVRVETLVGASDPQTEKVDVVTATVTFPMDRLEGGEFQTKEETISLSTVVPPPKDTQGP